MAQQVRMPSLGQTTDEMILVAWHKQVGEQVTPGEVLLEVETDKATLEVEATVGGTLLAVLYEPGDAVEDGQAIAWVGESGERVPSDAATRAQVSVPASSPPPVPRGVRPDRPAIPSGPPGKTLAAPAVRRLAAELGIDISTIRGTGPGGRVDREDVLASVRSRADGSEVPVHRRVIAERLTRSMRTIPQFTTTVHVDMSEAKRRLTELRSAGVGGITMTHLILRAMSCALRDVPAMNRRWIEEGPSYLEFGQTHVGVAVASENQLLIVTVPEPDALNERDLVTVTNAAVDRARRGKLLPSDMAGCAITLSNLGMHGVDSFDAIVDPDQTAILSVGQVQDRAVVVDKVISVVTQLTMSLTVDHRVVDGVIAARYLAAVRSHLGDSA